MSITRLYVININHSKNLSIPRLQRAAEAIFDSINTTDGSKGILLGGAAAIFLGRNRTTKDIDINVTKFPSIRNPELYNRPGSEGKRKITYMKDDEEKSVKCDISIERAMEVQDFIEYTVKVEGLRGVLVADLSFLLADKIRTYCLRHKSNEGKSMTDLGDISYCIETMHAWDIKMDAKLRTLYTSQDWDMVRKSLAHDVVEVAEKVLDITEVKV